jgi:hypothetical protein
MRFISVLLVVSASAWNTPAKASWVDMYDGLNSGYCQAMPPPGSPSGHYVAQDVRLCPENQKRSAPKQKLKRTKPKKER